MLEVYFPPDRSPEGPKHDCDKVVAIVSLIGNNKRRRTSLALRHNGFARSANAYQNPVGLARRQVPPENLRGVEL